MAVAVADYFDARLVVVVATRNACRIWPKQLRTWSDRTWEVASHGGLNRRTGLPLKDPSIAARAREAREAIHRGELAGRPVAILVNYAACWQGAMRDLLLSLEPDLLVLDESHNIKAPGGKWSQFCQQLARRSRRRLALTGTFLPHSKLDAYAQVRCLDEGVFGTSFAAHRARFAVMGGFENKEVVGWQNEREFEQRLARVSYVVESEDVLDLPPYHHVDRPLELEAPARRAYAGMDAEMVADVEGGVCTAANALSRLLRLAQVTSGHLPVEHDCQGCGGRGCAACEGTGLVERTVVVGSEKREALREWLEELPAGEPVVAFCRFRHDLDAVAAVAGELGRPYGEVSGRRSDLTADGTYPDGVTVLGVQIQAGSEGIDLTRASYAAYLSTGFDNGKYQQSLKRVHRPGQTRTTTFVHFLCDDTVDWVERRALEARQSAVGAVLDAVKRSGTTAAAGNDGVPPSEIVE